MNKSWTAAFLIIGTVVLATGKGQTQPQAQSGQAGAAAAPSSQAQLDTNNQENERDFDWVIYVHDSTTVTNGSMRSKIIPNSSEIFVEGGGVTV
jgi:hypothetical protein